MMIHLTNNSLFWLNTFTKITGDLKKNFDIASTFLKLLHISHFVSDTCNFNRKRRNESHIQLVVFIILLWR